MQNLSAAWLYPIILVAGALQAWGPPMNGALRNALTNPWLASLVSFLPIVAFLACLVLCQPHPLPTLEGITSMPWWAPLGGLVGAFAVVAGLVFVNKVGAGPFAGLLITTIFSCRSSSTNLAGSAWTFTRLTDGGCWARP